MFDIKNMELITKLDRTFLFASYFRALKNAQAKLKAQQQQQQQQQDVSVNFYVFFLCVSILKLLHDIRLIRYFLLHYQAGPAGFLKSFF